MAPSSYPVGPAGCESALEGHSVSPTASRCRCSPTLLRLTRDVADSITEFSVALLVGVIALALPYGYAVGLVVGTLVAAAAKRGMTAFGRGSDD